MKEQTNMKVAVYIKQPQMTSMKMTTDFVPIYKFCVENDLKKQNVYRWIRERKIGPENIKIIEKTVKRIYINPKVKIPR